MKVRGVLGLIVLNYRRGLLSLFVLVDRSEVLVCNGMNFILVDSG